MRISSNALLAGAAIVCMSGAARGQGPYPAMHGLKIQVVVNSEHYKQHWSQAQLVALQKAAQEQVGNVFRSNFRFIKWGKTNPEDKLILTIEDPQQTRT